MGRLGGAVQRQARFVMARLRWRSDGTGSVQPRSLSETATPKGAAMTATANPAKESLRQEQKEQRKAAR